ncbi:hypothetical protein F5X68DRAFT_248309 [Plectosphaerella plurivora]|uniref:Uncharacterized protein n=1 Tax=Plectosphaerella plurivora TaxID=936078 RepID=A0A9P8VK57_9PEZI|nr:hypothetical protein F5X68DRAFT_248309 [Plectosphaerella plurivora]
MRHEPWIVRDPLPGPADDETTRPAVPILFKGGVPKIGKSGAASKEFTFSFPDPTAPPIPPSPPRPLPTPLSSFDDERPLTPPSFGDETEKSTKFDFTFDAPKPEPHSIPSSNIPINHPIPLKMPTPATTPTATPASALSQSLTNESLSSLPPDMLRRGQLEVQALEEAAELQRKSKKTATAAKTRRRTHTTCTHTKMVRVYSLTLRCDICQSYGPFGWLYRCTEDREVLLHHAILEGISNKLNFDDLGQKLCKLVKGSPRSAEARSDVFSFFAEINAETMQTYTPEQISLILKQRENVRRVCREEMARIYETDGADERPNPAYEELKHTKPWVAKSIKECIHKVCPYCRPNGEERVYVSLDGVANGDVPATAATGFGFHIFGQRPVCDVSVVAKTGLRKETKMSVLRPEERATEFKAPGKEETRTKTRHRIFRPFLKGKLGFPLYTLDTTSDLAKASNSPVSPASNESASIIESTEVPRSPGIQRKNSSPRSNNSPGSKSVSGSNGSPGGNKGHLTRSHAAPNLPILTAAPPPSNNRVIDGVTQKTSLLTLVEEPEEEVVPKQATQQPATQMEKRELSTGHFEAKPLEVQDGVAVLEESIQLHLPDVISQV